MPVMKISAFSALLIAVFAFSTGAQTKLTLGSVIGHALTNSYTIRSAKLNLESSQANLEASERGLMTAVDFELDLPRFSRNLRSQFDPVTETDRFYQAGNTTVEARLSLSQPILFTNGKFIFNSSLFGRDQFTSSSGTKRDYYSSFNFRLQQPLFGFNSSKANSERAELNLERAKTNYKRSEADLIYNVTAAFYDAYKNKKQYEIAREKVRQTELSFNTANKKFKAGLIAEVEALQLEVDLAAARNDLLGAETSLRESKNNLKIAAGFPMDEDVDVTGSFEFVEFTVNTDTAVAYALRNRAEIKNAETDILLNRFTVEETAARGRITGQLNAAYGINKDDAALNDAFRAFLDDKSVSFTVQVPVWDWGKNGKEVESASANLKMAQLSAENEKIVICKEIETVCNRLQAAKARYEVLSRSVELAQKSYDISVSRFESGNITSFDLSQMQLRLTDSKLNSLGALIDYLLAAADLQRKTLHRF